LIRISHFAANVTDVCNGCFLHITPKALRNLTVRVQAPSRTSFFGTSDPHSTLKSSQCLSFPVCVYSEGFRQRSSVGLLVAPTPSPPSTRRFSSSLPFPPAPLLASPLPLSGRTITPPGATVRLCPTCRWVRSRMMAVGHSIPYHTKASGEVVKGARSDTPNDRPGLNPFPFASVLSFLFPFPFFAACSAPFSF